MALAQKGLDFLQAQGSQAQQFIFYALVALVVSLLIWITKQSLQSRQAKRVIEKQKQGLATNTQLLKNFKVGMLHLNQAGEIVFANRVAAYFLGSKEEKLVGQKITTIVEKSQQEQVDAALTGEQSTPFLCYMQTSKRHLHFAFSQESHPELDINWVVSISDVSNFQHKINQSAQQHESYQQALAQLQIGQLNIDLDKKQFSLNSVLAESLQIKHALSGELKQFNARIKPTQLMHWEQLLKQAQEQPNIEFIADFLPAEIAHSTNQGSEPKELEQHYVRLRIVGQYQEQAGKGRQLVCFVENLAELAQQEQQFYISQQQTQALLSANLQPAYLLNNHSEIVNCNSAFESLVKQRLSKLKGQSIQGLQLFSDEITAMHTKNAGSLVGAQFGQEKECDLHLDSETTKQVKVKLSYVLDADKNRCGLVGVIHDLTELKQLKQQLSQTQKHFTSIIDLAPVAVTVIDAEGGIVSANIAMTDRLGLSERELKQQGFYALFNDPENANKARKTLISEARLRNFVAKLKGKNEQLFASELHIDCLNKEKQEYLCWIWDRSKEQYHQDKFDGLLEHSSMPMAVLAEQGFTQLNPAACKFFKLNNQQDLLGRYPFEPELNLDQQGCSELERQVNKVKLDGQAKSFAWEHLVNNQTIPCHITLVPMYKGTEFDSILCVWADLRDLKKADEERLAAINSRLAAEKAAAEKQQQLTNSQAQLASKARNLADTESKLQAAKQDLSEKQHAFSDLQQAHKSVTDNLQQLQQEYNQNRQQLSQAQQDNSDLAEQLEATTAKVSGLQAQRNQISDALQNSEKRYKEAQQALDESEENAEKLKQQQLTKQQQLDEFAAEIDSLKSSMQQKDQQLQDVAGQINSLQSQLTSSGNTSEKLRQQLVNQRKASEEAEQQRRQLEQTYKVAQSELSTKVRHVEHLQNEKLKLEEMSNQQKGDMQALQAQLKEELEAKQQQLQLTQKALNESKQAAEQEKQAREKQQQEYQRLQTELAEAEARSQQQQANMAKTEQKLVEQQQQIEQELQQKQQQLKETQENLDLTKEQTQAEKDQQQQLLAKLQSELAEVQSRSDQQQQKIAERDENWQAQQQALQSEVEAKRQQLQSTQDKLNNITQQADVEKLARIEQQQKLEQLTIELSDVENRANKQKQMLEGSDEQWRKHHEEIEQQKQQLQQALKDAEQQNSQLQEKLQGNLEQLQIAESQVTETKSTEQQLQDELDKAREDAQSLQQRLKQQEDQERKLQAQLKSQQTDLAGSEKSIQSLEAKQAELTAQLKAVQSEYSQSKASLTDQHSNHAELTSQLNKLEQELKNSKGQLDDKEQALQQANQQLRTNQAKLAEQESQLLNAHKEELKQAKSESKVGSEISKIEFPSNPKVWFDLLTYLQGQEINQPLPEVLTDLMQSLQNAIQETDKAVGDDDVTAILAGARKLVMIANKVNSDALTDAVTRLEADCRQGLVDNIAIAWPTVQRSLNNTLRVIYSHLNH
ncbi:PAS domain-containing protein [Paraglaciecola aestuariivivens]